MPHGSAIHPTGESQVLMTLPGNHGTSLTQGLGTINASAKPAALCPETKGLEDISHQLVCIASGIVFKHVTGAVWASWSILCTLMVSSRKNCLGEKYLEIAQRELPCDFLEGVAHCTLLISEHQVSMGCGEVSS